MENPGGHLGPSLVDSSQLLNGGLAVLAISFWHDPAPRLTLLLPPPLRSPPNQKVAC